MSRFPYQFFKKYIVRTPLFSREEFQKKIYCDTVSEDHLKTICIDSRFQEAIYLASPYLYLEINHWLAEENKLSEKLKHTILKYYSRMSTRSTPFGLFSHIGLGDFCREKVSFTDFDGVRDTKLDMHFLVALSKSLEQNPAIRNKLLFFPNNTIYRVGNNIRFVEYEFSTGKRDYIISSAPISEELDKIIQKSKKGKTVAELTGFLINEAISSDDAEYFIQELINNQVLVSELEPNVSGAEFLSVLIGVLGKINARAEVRKLIEIQEKLNTLDQNIGNKTALYRNIEEIIASFGTDYDQKYLFQTDLYNNKEFQIPEEWKKKLKKAILFLNKITVPNTETPLEKFKKAFSERYETEEIPLSIALDSEIGVGYRQDVLSKGIHPYLEDLAIPFSKNSASSSIHLNAVQQILNEKLQNAILENDCIIQLSDHDFKDFAENLNDLPDTISFMAEIISENHAEKLVLNGGGGNSAAGLLGRFCSDQSQIQILTKSIAEKEEELNTDSILTEIIHLPEARIGNIIRRPTLRKYEIPYLAQSLLSEERQIPLDDLFISVKNNRIFLRSKKRNQEVKPYLTNAHNYSSNSLPVYHFLCDLFSQNKRSELYFNWGGLKYIYKFLPRIEFEGIILSKAQWKINENDVQSLISLIQNKEEFSDEIKRWRKKRKLPQWIQWVKSDNTLAINLENYDFAKLFVETVKKEKVVILEEFLWNENDDFTRQFVFPMYKIK